MIRCIAFDCFGTVSDMSTVSRDEIRAYVDHVRKADFSPFAFPKSWWELKSHPDAKEGIASLRKIGFFCVTLSNGEVGLLSTVAESNGIEFDEFINLERHRVYKPNVHAYRTVEKDMGFKPYQTLMVTANPSSGDIEGAAAIGMPSQVIRQPGKPQTIVELAELLSNSLFRIED